MSVIIRLQNLPWSANALDIRQYFRGLSIPEGGVHIVGGELGDAFIAFSTDEDARQAFNMNNGKIKEVQIKLMLSSRTEMQKVIEAARTQSLAAFMQTTPAQMPTAVPPILPAVVPAAIPEIKRDEREVKGDKRDKRRSRSRSRERKDRSRERDRRDRRRRDRSRSRSRERRDRRRRDRSRSRDRTRSKETDRRSKDRRSTEKNVAASASVPHGAPKESSKPGMWDTVIQQQEIPTPQSSALHPPLYPPSAPTPLMNAPIIVDDRNGYPNSRNNNFNSRWNEMSGMNEGSSNYQNRRFQNHNEDRYGEQNQLRNNRLVPDEYNKGSYDNNSRAGFNRPMSDKSESMNSRYNERPERQERQENYKNCCVKLQPYYGGFGEVRRFFQGIFIHNTGIKFVNDEFGKRTGLVYVRCAYPEGKEDALLRNSTMLKNQPVEVTHLEDHVFEATIDRYQPDQNSYAEEEMESEPRYRGKNITKYFNKNTNQQLSPVPPKVFSCLVIEDLPTYAKEQDILKMFSDYSLMSIIMVNKPRKIHVAYVQFSNPDDAKAALHEKGKHSVDGKPVTVNACRDDVFEDIQREQSEIPEEPSPEKQGYINSECILLTRLPLKTNDRDISDFFSDIGIIPTKIHLMSNSMGFVGEAYCEFNSIDEARAAVEKNGMPLGSSIVSVKSVDRSDMESILGLSVTLGSPSPNMVPNLRAPIAPLLMNQPRQFFPRNNNYPPAPRGPNFMGPRPRRFFPQQRQNGGDDSFGPPGCTVLMENVPYKATVEEILQFFDGFDIPPDNILRRYNPNGKPSGESKVIFKNADDAYQAVRQNQEHKIRDRTVYLTLC